MHTFIVRIIAVLLAFQLIACSTEYHIASTSYKQYRIHANDGVPPDPELEAFIEPYRQSLKKKTKEVLIRSQYEITKGKPESTLGNFFSDAFYEESAKLTQHPLAFAAQNYGGLRRPSLPEGDITIGHIYELMPFENFIVILRGDSALLQNFFDHVAQHGGWPVSKQVRMRIKDKKATDIRINGRPLESGKTYFFALPDYTANGGDRFFFLKDVPREETGVLIRDAIINNLQEKGKNGVELQPALDHRIIIEQP